MTDNTILQDKNADGTISVKEVILKLAAWRKYMMRRWKLLLVISLIGAILGLILSIVKTKQYVGQLTFVLDEAKSSPLGAYANIASQIGIDLGGSGESSLFTEDNIMEFLKSRLMIEQALLSPVDWNGEKLTLADLYLKKYDWRKKWVDRPDMANFSFAPGVTNLSRQQDSIMGLLYMTITKSNLVVDKVDKKLSFIMVKTTTNDEIFSKFFTERLVDVAASFYISTKTKRTQSGVDKLQAQADSLLDELNRKMYSVAQVQDFNLNPAKHIATVGGDMANRDKVILTTMYGEVVKNLELAKMTLMRETPIIQVVDRPIMPLKVDKLGKLMGIVLGGLLFGFLGVFFLTIRGMYRSVMR